MNRVHEHKRFYQLTENASTGIFEAGASGECTYTNKTLQSLLGLTYEQTLGQGYATYFHPDDVGEFEYQLQQHLDDPFIKFNIECRLFSQKQHELWFQIVGEAIREEQGIPFRMVGSISDITDRKQSQIVIW